MRPIEAKAEKQLELALAAAHWLEDQPEYSALAIQNPTPLWFRRLRVKPYRRRLYRRLKKLMEAHR